MLNFIVSTETFSFSDLTYWLMTQDSLTHLTQNIRSQRWKVYLPKGWVEPPTITLFQWRKLTETVYSSGAPNENIIQNDLNIALLNVF